MLKNGMIEGTANCPFRGQCYFAGTSCPANGARQQNGASCAMARLFDAALESGEMTMRRC